MSTLDLPGLPAAQLHARNTACAGCGRRGTSAAHAVRKAGPNTGRLFMNCGSCGRFTWLSGGGAATRRPPKEERPAPTQGQSEELGLLDDIATHPADDAPRLIYADWLEDRGDTSRAEFVRAGVALDRGGPDARHRELLDRYGPSWFATLMDHATAWHLAGGLVDGVTLPGATFAAHAEALLREAPAAEWAIGVASWSELKLVVSCPAFARVRRLKLDGCHLGGDGVRILSACPRAAGLRSLALPGVGLGQPGVASLTMSAYLRELRALDLSRCALSDSAVAVLASTSNLPHLHTLTLAHNPLGDPAVRSLLNSRHLKELKHLDLSGCGAVGNEAAEALADSAFLGRLRYLNLTQTGVGTGGRYRLRRSPHARPDLDLLS